MLGRKTFSAAEIQEARALVDRQLAAYDAAPGGADTEATWFLTATLALDRVFVHRIRSVTGKAGTPLNELELVTMAVLHHFGRFTTDNVIRYRAEESVLGLADGDTVLITRDGFAALAAGCLAELEAKFLEPAPA